MESSYQREKSDKNMSLNKLKKESQRIKELVERIREERKRKSAQTTVTPEIVKPVINDNEETQNDTTDPPLPAVIVPVIEKDKSVALSVIRLPSVSIEQNAIISYDKQTQCNESVSNYSDSDEYDNDIESYSSYVSVQNESKNDSEMKTDLNDGNDNRDQQSMINVNTERKLTYNQLEMSCIFNDQKFRQFLDYSIKITERALFIYEKREKIFNGFGSIEESDNNISNSDSSDCGLMLNQCFYSSSLCKERVVTSFDWCPQYKELLLSTYSGSVINGYNDGVCLIWNLNYFNDKPEYVFRSQSPLMSSCFSGSASNLIIGGTYSGQIVVWDKRSSRYTPTLKTTISPQSHTHPVFCLKAIGNRNNSNDIISVSNDGKMCEWSLNALRKPIHCRELEHEWVSESLSLRIRKPITATSMCFPCNHFSHVIIGSENGNLFGIEKDTAKVNRVFESSHNEMVTSVDCHPEVNHSNLLLTSSLDWTVKLWNQYSCSAPLHTFDSNGDSVYDVKWSPTDCASFATVNACASIDLWHINSDIYAPICSHQLNHKQAINRLIWTPSGKQLIAGDSVGKVWLFDVKQSLRDNQFSISSQTFDQFRQNI